MAGFLVALPIVMAGMALLGNTFSLFPPLGDFWAKTAYGIFPSKISTITDLITAYRRKEISEEEFYKVAGQNGYKKEIADQLFASSQALIGAYDSVTAWRRGILTEDALTLELEKQGYIGDRIETIKKVTEFFPTASDLISFARRDIFSAATVEFFGYSQGLPDIPPELLKGAGLSDENWLRYWQSHWRDIEYGMSSEMLHRRVIDDKEYDLMLRAANYPPGVVDKLKQISYNPLTRVDVRRMYRIGVLKEEDVYNAYRDIGYSEENANLMTEFTKRYESGEDVGVSRASLIQAYKRDILTSEELEQYLRALDYSEDTVKFWLTMADYEKMQDEIDMLIDDIIARYRKGAITIQEVEVELNQLDIPSKMVNTIIRNENMRVAEKLKIPSKADLTSWLKKKLIPIPEFTNRMLSLGYRDFDIQLYVQEITGGEQ